MKAAKTAVLGLVCLAGGAMLGGCGIGPGLGKQDLFKIDNQRCPLAEAKVLLANYQKQYADLYGVDLWDEAAGQEEDLETYVKDLTLTELADIYTMDLIGQEKEIALSDTEKNQADQAAKAYYGALSDKEKSYMGISGKEMETLYERYALAQKVYDALTEDVSREVSDNEARVMKVQQIFTTSEDAARKAKARLDKGGDFDKVTEEYSETAKRSANIDRSMIPQEAQESVFALKENQISDIVQTEDGYYIFRCVQSYDAKLTEANKEKVLEVRLRKAVDDSCDAQIKAEKSTLNRKAWDETALCDPEDLSETDFFSVFEKYCGGDTEGSQGEETTE